MNGESGERLADVRACARLEGLRIVQVVWELSCPRVRSEGELHALGSPPGVHCRVRKNQGVRRGCWKSAREPAAHSSNRGH